MIFCMFQIIFKNIICFFQGSLFLYFKALSQEWGLWLKYYFLNDAQSLIVQSIIFSSKKNIG